MKYDVIRADDIKTLVEEVEQAILEGWVPLGGICLSETVTTKYEAGDAYEATTSTYLQAMTK